MLNPEAFGNLQSRNTRIRQHWKLHQYSGIEDTVASCRYCWPGQVADALKDLPLRKRLKTKRTGSRAGGAKHQVDHFRSFEFRLGYQLGRMPSWSTCVLEIPNRLALVQVYRIAVETKSSEQRMHPSFQRVRRLSICAMRKRTEATQLEISREVGSHSGGYNSLQCSVSFVHTQG